MNSVQQDEEDISSETVTFYQQFLIVDKKLDVLVLNAGEIEQLMTQHRVDGIKPSKLSSCAGLISVFKTDGLNLLVRDNSFIFFGIRPNAGGKVTRIFKARALGMVPKILYRKVLKFVQTKLYMG